MAEIGTLRQIRPTQSQLPVSWYFDPKIFELEKRLLFDAGANYVGHELMVPKVGDYHTLRQAQASYLGLVDAARQAPARLTRQKGPLLMQRPSAPGASCGMRCACPSELVAYPERVPRTLVFQSHDLLLRPGVPASVLAGEVDDLES